jgi:hypothetical protein
MFNHKNNKTDKFTKERKKETGTTVGIADVRGYPN